jgi:hypothetical protein
MYYALTEQQTKLCIDFLRKCAVGDVSRKDGGFCDNLLPWVLETWHVVDGITPFERARVPESVLHTMRLWPKASGNYVFPVPMPAELESVWVEKKDPKIIMGPQYTETMYRAALAYEHSPDKWVGAYGALRMEMCGWMVEQLEARLCRT